MTVTVLQVEQVRKSIGGVKILNGISLTVNRGERRAVIGPNGAGKTTLFRIIAGELYPDSGSIRIFGEDVTHLPPHLRARKGMLRTFQKSSLFPELTVRENLLISALQGRHGALGIFRLARRDRMAAEEVESVLEDWELAHVADSEVKHLPYGLQRRLELAITFLRKPRLLLLDEPTAGLAAEDVDDVTKRLQQLPAETTLVLIEHNLRVVFSIAQKITVLHHGELLAEGTGEEIRSDPVIQSAYLGSVKRGEADAL